MMLINVFLTPQPSCRLSLGGGGGAATGAAATACMQQIGRGHGEDKGEATETQETAMSEHSGTFPGTRNHWCGRFDLATAGRFHNGRKPGKKKERERGRVLLSLSLWCNMEKVFWVTILQYETELTFPAPRAWAHSAAVFGDACRADHRHVASVRHRRVASFCRHAWVCTR